MKISERKKVVLGFLEKEFTKENEHEGEKLLILMEGIKAGLDLRKEDKKEVG